MKKIIQTEAERRMREAGVQQSIENGLGSRMYVYIRMTQTQRVKNKVQKVSFPGAAPITYRKAILHAKKKWTPRTIF